MRNYFQTIGLNVLCFCGLALVSLSYVSALQSCQTPTGANGYCVPLSECTWYTDNKKKFGPNFYPKPFVNHVKKSICFVENDESSIHMCCDAEFVQQTISTATPAITTPSTLPVELISKSLTTDYTSNLNPKGVEILNQTSCGHSGGTRVANGVDTNLFEFPWMALLRYDTAKDPFKCGGSLITSKYVLTAAHCIITDIDLIGVRLGEWDLNTDPDSQLKGNKILRAPPVEDFAIADKIVHPKYDKQRILNDVALVKLKSIVKFNRHIKPICLPITQQSIDEPRKEFFIAGWGTTENSTTSTILQKATVTHQPLQECKDTFQSDSVTEDTICAGGTSNVDSCKGDSGGPLFFTAPYRHRLSQRYIQFGIVSLGGIKCGLDRAYPGIYASVVRFMPWITSNLD